MSPILKGIVASGISGRLNVPADYFSISSAIVTSGGTSSVVFSSIPNTYSHLQLVIVGRSDRGSSAPGDAFKIQFNGDTSASYHYGEMNGNGSGSPTASKALSINNCYIDYFPAVASTSLYQGVAIIEIIDYKNTTKHKQLQSNSGMSVQGGNMTCYFDTNTWASTSAINQITITANVGATISADSRISLYGIK
jgi:hypothetical protein